MKNVAVISLDHTKAHFLILRPAERPKEQWSPILLAEEQLKNAFWDEQKNETLTGGNRFSYHVGMSGMAQTMHGYDDHLARHQREISRRFSREVYEHLKKFTSKHKVQELVIVAERKMLGDLREQLDENFKQALTILEIKMNLTNLSPTALHEHLSKLGALPRKLPPTDAQKVSFARSGQWRRRGKPGEGQGETAAGSELGF